MLTKKRIIKIASVGILVLAVIGARLYGPVISDTIRMHQYQPSAEIAELSDMAALSDRGRFYFYVAHPSLDNANEFNESCHRVEKNSPILGCYDAGANQIHIYKTEYKGMNALTAAHEMLHVAWSRMSESDRGRLGKLLEQAYERNKSEDLEKRMAYYERAQPGERVNELHSILGTEYADIGTELDEHYRQFFTDRHAVVAISEEHTVMITGFRDRADALTTKLDAQEKTITQQSAEYEQSVADFNRRVEIFNDRAERGDFVSQEAFRAERAGLAQESQRIAAQYKAINEAIAEYNKGVEELRLLGKNIDTINKKLDSYQEIQ